MLSKSFCYCVITILVSILVHQLVARTNKFTGEKHIAPQSDIRISTDSIGTHAQNTSIDSAVTLDAPTGAERILIQAESQSIQ